MPMDICLSLAPLPFPTDWYNRSEANLDLEAITPHTSLMSLQQILTFHLGLLRARSEETIIPLGFCFGTSAASTTQL